jgi:hypothetical protein
VEYGESFLRLNRGDGRLLTFLPYDFARFSGEPGLFTSFSWVQTCRGLVHQRRSPFSSRWSLPLLQRLHRVLHATPLVAYDCRVCRAGAWLHAETSLATSIAALSHYTSIKSPSAAADLEAEVAQSATQVVLDGDRLRRQQLAMRQQHPQFLAA